MPGGAAEHRVKVVGECPELLSGNGFRVSERDGCGDFGVLASVAGLHAGEHDSAEAGHVEHDGLRAVFAEAAPVPVLAPLRMLAGAQRPAPLDGGHLLPLACSARR